MPNFSVSDFLKSIEQTNSVKYQTYQDDKENQLVEKVYLAKPENHGRYQVFPMTSTVTGLPFVQMPKTREIKIPRTLRKSDGTEATYEYWVKILPHNAFNIVDETGRETSGLTSQESQLLTSVQNAFDRLYANMGGYEKEKENNQTIGRLRKKNYTIFFAKCLQKWGISNPRTAERTNFSGLFICAAKGFIETLNDNIQEVTTDAGGDEGWLNQIYNRDLTGRTGYLSFNISLPQNIVGYKLSIDHKYNSQLYVNESITPEEAAIMTDPVAMFLGWQVDRETGKNFNTRVMEETLAFINAELTKYPDRPVTTSSAPAGNAPTAAFGGVAPSYGAQAQQAPTAPSSPRVDPFTGQAAGADGNAATWSTPQFAQNPWRPAQS